MTTERDNPKESAMTGPPALPRGRTVDIPRRRADAPTLADLLAKEEASSPPLEPSERSEHMDRWRADQVAHRAADRLDDWHRAQDKSTRRTLIKLT
jgi:hypothetical protein